MFESDLRGRAVAVRSYARSLGATILLREVPDPLASGLTADAAWLLVRAQALQRASLSTEVAISEWAVALRRVAEAACCGGGRVVCGSPHIKQRGGRHAFKLATAAAAVMVVVISVCGGRWGWES